MAFTRKVRRGGRRMGGTRKARRGGRRPLAKPAAKAVARIAKRVFNRNTETNYVADNSAFNYEAIYGDVIPTATPSAPQLYTCVPPVTQGDTSYERQGERINPVKHRTDLIFAFSKEQLIAGTPNLRVDQAGWDLTVHVWYGFARRYKHIADVQGNMPLILNNMFDDGNGVNTRWTGLLSDELKQVNTEIVSLKHRKLRLFKNAGLDNVLDTVAPSLTAPEQMVQRMSINWKIPKSLRYEIDSSPYPENYAPFIVVGYCHNDLTQASNDSNDSPTNNVLEIPAVSMCQVNKLWFKDA